MAETGVHMMAPWQWPMIGLRWTGEACRLFRQPCVSSVPNVVVL
jgi:hypothetical protein